MLLILERLYFAELINVAEIGGKYATHAVTVFRYKHSNIEIRLYDNFRLSSNTNDLLNVAEMDIDADEVERVNRRFPTSFYGPMNFLFADCDSLLKMFKHFGHLIKKLKFTVQKGAVWDLQREMIGKLITKYSRESLKEITFENNVEDMLQHIKKPLINVEHVKVVWGFTSDNHEILGPNQLFPNLRRLTLNFLSNIHFAYFDQHMPHVEAVAMIRTFKYVDSSRFANLIEKNPQIKSIELRDPDTEFIRAVHNNLLKLETLKLFDFRWNYEEIRFENVTTFSIDHKPSEEFNTSPANISFPRLQTLHIARNKRRFNDYCRFVTAHSHLSRLHMGIHEMQYLEFKRLTEKLENLAELTIDGKYVPEPLTPNTIVRWLQSHKNVMKFNVIGFPAQILNEFKEQLKNKWNTNIIYGGLSFVRISFRN